MFTRKPAPRVALVLAMAAPIALGACVGGGGGGGGDDPPFPFPTEAATATAAPTRTPAPTPTPTPEVDLATLEGARQNLRAGAYVESAAEYRVLAQQAEEPQLAAEAWLGAAIATYLDGDLEGSLQDLAKAYASAIYTSSERRVAYLYGLRLVESGRFTSGAEVLAGPATTGNDVLRPYLLATYARALAGDGRMGAANQAWDSALALPQTTPAVKLSIYRTRADAAIAAGDNVSAVDWLSRSVGLAARPEVRYELAELAASIGDMETYRAQLTAIVFESPSTPWAESAVSELQGGGYGVDLGQAGYVQYRRRNYTEARALLSAAVEEPGISTDELVFRTYYLAASYDDDGLVVEAVPIYDSIQSIAPASPYAHRAMYWAARAMEIAGNAAVASQRYVEVVQASVAGEFTSESAFRAGFVLLGAGDPAGALARWSELPVTVDGRLLYWQGRAQEALDDSGAARATFERAADQDPVSFYGQAAAVRLGRVSLPPASFQPVGQFAPIDWDAIADWIDPGAAALPAVESAAGDLADLGLVNEATSLLQQEVAARNLTRLEFLAYLRTAHEAGLTSLAARWATQMGAGSRDVPEDLARLAYPLDYVDLMNRHGDAYDVDPLFLAALIRQESYWDVDAISVASARGLTQVIPSTGQGIATELGYTDWDVSDLFRPAVSLQFGAYYIGHQLKRFGSPLAALSAYNGGPGNAAHWVENALSPDPADFVEAVTFNETRGYVVIVMENYARYLQLYRPPRP